MDCHHHNHNDEPERARRRAPVAPRAFRALSTLWERAIEPGAEPAAVDASDVLTALWTAAVRIGAGDDHILHWLANSSDLGAPRRILGRQRSRAAQLRLAAYDRACPEHRRAVRETITDALTPGATP